MRVRIGKHTRVHERVLLLCYVVTTNLKKDCILTHNFSFSLAVGEHTRVSAIAKVHPFCTANRVCFASTAAAAALAYFGDNE